MESKIILQRTYVPYYLWEEYHFGMWRNTFGRERGELFSKAVKFTGNAELYGSYMLIAIDKWIYSCLHNLSCTEMNRQAWIGHAACCIAINSPEDVTRQAWHYLTQKQQDEANAKADYAIYQWELRYKRGIQAWLNLA
jgi:hypothetical protein